MMYRPLTALAAPAALVAACTPADSAADTDTSASSSPTAAEVSPESVRAMIEEDGAQPTVAALWNDYDGSAWDAVANGVESGEQAWLDLAPLIMPGTENATAYDMAYALSRALIANPAGVLATVGGDGGHCYNIEVEYADDQGQIARSNDAYYPAAIAAVEGVTDPALSAAREACLMSLRAGQTEAG